MAEIKVEREPHLRDRFEPFDRRLLLPILAIALGLLLLWGINDLNRNRATNANIPSAPMAAQGRVWVPMGQVALLPDRQMVRVGKTSDGRELFDLPQAAGGGGGQAVVEGPQGVARAFVRVGEDRYQAVALLPVAH